MAGFPTRISRATLGPKRKDFDEAVDETYYVSARFIEMLFHQVCGMNLLSSRCGGLIVSNALAAHEESWAPDGGAAPTFSHVATGHYRITYPATADDEAGNTVAIALTRARGFVQGAAARSVTATASGSQVDVYLFDAAGSTVDGDVWFEAF